uniref:Putative Carbamoyltransferase n=1 Tax=mine drainage metagenome TaxID=410659 RepID=E6QWM3_9ZZZZ
MRLLGYSGLNHDSAVALLEDGKLVFACESEKIRRAKHEVSPFPDQAVRRLLSVTGLDLGDIDAFAVNYDAGILANWGYLPHLWACLRQRNADLGIIANSFIISASHSRTLIHYTLSGPIPPIRRVRHHLAHLASTFLYSTFDKAAVAVIDASGELDCTTTYRCVGRTIKRLSAMTLPTDSLGSVYMMATRHLGYRLIGDEYKVMGLASFGEADPVFRRFFQELIVLEDEGRYRVNPRLAGRMASSGCQFPEAVANRLGGRHTSGPEVFTEAHKSFARELQRRIEEAILHVIRHLRKVSGCRHLCLAGGVALNSVANGRLKAESGFEDIFVPPAPHDAGTSIGAAAYLHYYEDGLARPEPLNHAYLGQSFSEDAIEAEIRRCGLAVCRLADPAQEAARRLVQGEVIGWFQGASEFGPRALGNRSILADPRTPEMKDQVNRRIKEREGYRPFAPSVLEEAAEAYFPGLGSSPYMLFVVPASDKARAEIPAVVHIDGTARPQIVSAEVNPLYHCLISYFAETTGVPAVLNTSFNVAGEPIVNTPADAIRCFFGSGLDALVMGPFLLEKSR